MGLSCGWPLENDTTAPDRIASTSDKLKGTVHCMANASPPPVGYETFAEVLARLGDIPPERIRLRPPPGTATEADAIHSKARFGRLCELVDGTLVEKPMGYYESRVAAVFTYFIETFLGQHDLGIVLGADGMVRVDPGQIREPDVSFFSWDHFPNRVLPPGAVLDMTPDLAIEILSPSNTKSEMARKRRELFLGGTRLVWEVDAEKQTVRVYTAPDESTLLRQNRTLDGGSVLPGFSLPLRQLFDRAGQRG
jgi:Uma2 family endonuclease